MNNQDRNPEQLATAVLKAMLGMFPTMAAVDKDLSVMYSNEMAAAIALNDRIGLKEIEDGIKYLRSGKYTSTYAPSIPQFISMCKVNMSAVKYLPPSKPIQRTEQEAKELHDKGNEALAKIKDILK